jgi:hypothetical protein
MTTLVTPHDWSYAERSCKSYLIVLKAHGGNDGFPRTAAFLDALIKGVQVSQLSDGEHGALYQGRPHQLAAALGDTASIVHIVGGLTLGTMPR